MSNLINDTVDEYKELLKRIKAYNEAINLMYWDLRTGAPKKAIEGRSEVIGLLSTDVFELTTSDQMKNLLEGLLADDNREQLDAATLKSLQEMKRSYDHYKKIPAKQYKEYVILVAKSESVWEEAKEKSDFKLLKPYLEQIVKYNQEFIELWGYQGNRYNALLDQYEPGMTVEQLDPIFKDLRESLVPLVNKVAQASPINTKFLRKQYSLDKQRNFSHFILKKMGYDFNAGRLDTTIHPFQITLNSGDVRVTTKFEEDDIAVGLFGTLHEGGHAQYEQNINKNLEELLLAEGTSMGIHESQSRFWENIVGRSNNFWEFYYKELVSLFPDQLNDVSKRDFYLAVNQIKPSIIRIEADELTYNLHIMIRYELEKSLINGEIAVEELPEAWNNKMKEYLGIVPDCHADGVLQDVHWSSGLFGYFPTYTLGNIYAAQFLHKMKQELPEFDDMLRLGNLIPLKAWLNNRIHQYGKLKNPIELLEEVTGEKLNAKYLVDYLTKKVENVYEV